MLGVTKLSSNDFELLMKYKGKTVYWRHPRGSKGYYGTIVGIEKGFLLHYDGIATEGIKEDWIQFVSK